MAGHTLDLLITREHDNLLVQEPEKKSYNSDHCFIRAVTTLTGARSDFKRITYRKICDLDMDKFKSDLLSSKLFDLNGKSVHEKAEIYDKVLSDTLDTHAPKITKTIKIKQGSPWFNNELRLIKIEKRKAERAWKKSGKQVDYETFRELCFKYGEQCKSAKTSHYSSEVQKCCGDQKKLYKLVKNLTNGETSSVFPDSGSDQSLSEEFSDYFIDKIDRIMSDITNIIENEKIDSNIQYQAMDNVNEFTCFRSLSEDEVMKLIKQSKTKSSILDPIPTAFLKKCIDIMIHPISDIINSSLLEGEFPNCWKCPVVTPLLKKSGLEPLLKNYRPVSNLPYISKIIEKAGLQQYNQHLDSAGLSIKDNSAYKHMHSTETLLARIQCDIFNNMDQQKITVLILLDLSAAFDTVDINILNDIFTNRFNINGNVLKWFNTYLRGRGQKVRINEAISQERRIKCGVPQGSCAGPVVFLGYLSTLYETINKHLPYVKVMGYADDHQLYIAFNAGDSSLECEMLGRLEDCISDVRRWMLRHHLRINDSKTEVMVLGTQAQLDKINFCSVKVGQSDINFATTVRNLGVLFDQQLNMYEHVNAICRKGFIQIKRIRQVRKYLDRQATEQLVHSFVTSNIDFCNVVLYGAPKGVIQKLQRLQNGAARVIVGLRKFDPCRDVLKSLHWLPVMQRIDYKIALLTFKCRYKLAPQYLSELLIPYAPQRSLRSRGTNLLLTPRTSTKTLGPRAFSSAAPAIWNSLPEECRLLKSIDSFKKAIKTHFFKIAYGHSP